MWDVKLKKLEQEKLPQLAAELWNADKDSIKLVNSGINLVYRFTSHSKGKYLRITHPVIRSSAELAAAIAYQKFLFDAGAPICEPIKSNHGNLIEELSYDDDIFLVHVIDEVKGDVVNFDNKDEHLYQTWGKSLAHVHRAAKSYHPGETHKFLYWNDLWEEVGRNIQEEDEVIKQEYAAIDDWFTRLPKDIHDFGLTHGDHISDNVIYDGHQIHIIDFDEPVYHWFWADIARPFLELDNQKFHKWKDKAACFLDGYNTILPFDEDKINYLPWFIRMKNLDIYTWMQNNPTAPFIDFREERLRELRENIINPLDVWNL